MRQRRISAPRRTRLGVAAAASVAAAAAVSLGTAPTGHATGSVGFTAPSFVSMTHAGGEPLVLYSAKYGTLVYSSHEGTTHIDRTGLASSSTEQFLCPDVTTADCYKNHVWVWTSKDNGASWQLTDEGLSYQGFSDPDLTTDAAGTIYDTGIDLANDSVFSSSDGGVTWPTGTTNCHEGDRPWLAGGVAGEVFMETDTEEGGHTLYHSSNYAASCDSTGIADSGTMPDGLSWSGFAKGLYDPVDKSFIEPAQFTGSNGVVKVGISRLANAADAFNGGSETFQPQEVAATNGLNSPFGAPNVLSMDSAQNLYFAWDTDDRDPSSMGGCGQVPNTNQPSGGPTPKPNHIMLEIGKYVSPGHWDWQKPISLAHQGDARVLWPWSVAGTPGNLSVVWYQMDKMVDPDCDQLNGNTIPDVNTFIYEAHISNALDPQTRAITVSNASGRAIHQGGICNSGTTCVASGQDRRLGDFFSNAIDANGCVIIASGDTTIPDDVTGQPRATSMPIFIRQNSGPSLTGKDCANPSAAAVSTPASNVAGVTTTPPPTQPTSTPPAALPNTSAAGSAVGSAGLAGGAGAVAAILVSMSRRRRRRP